jgi:putative SOS response-associated peptidase YedK
MCGRYTVSGGDVAGLRSRFGLDERVEVRQRFNVAPGDEVLAITAGGGTLLRWGFLRDNAYTTINARAESLLDKPTWRNALDDARCLIVADGFYEWQKRADANGVRKQPFWITRSDHEPFAFAGLASPWGTCAIVTTTASDRLADLHDRMPVILEPGAESEWLAPRTRQGAALSLLRSFEDTVAVPVSGAVNDARYDGPGCLEPAPPPDPTLF